MKHHIALITLITLIPTLATAQESDDLLPTPTTKTYYPSESEMVKRLADAEEKLAEQNAVMVKMAMRLVELEKREKARAVDAKVSAVDAKLPTIVFFGPTALVTGATWIANAANNEQPTGRAAALGALSGLVGGTLMGVGYKVDDPMTIVAGGILTVAAIVAPFVVSATQ